MTETTKTSGTASTFLERIVASTRADLEARKAEVPLDMLRERVVPGPEITNPIGCRSFRWALRPAGYKPGPGGARLIAEVKRASPSKGLLAERFDPIAQARAYQAGGAAVISVLTEPHFFQGSLDHLRAVSQAVDRPVLRKDFVIDPYQVYEARDAGADAVLLICALLDDASLRDLLALTLALGMEALVEAHNAEETRRAVASGARVIGVNARDLRTFAVDSAVIQHLRPLVPPDRVFVAESGISDRLGAMRARAWGADAILVGEALMRAADPTVKARELASTAEGGRIHHFFASSAQPVIKLCGLTTPEQFALAGKLDAYAGLMFAPQAPAHRRLTPEQACVLVGRGSVEMLTASRPSAKARFPRPARKGEPQTVGVFVNEDPRTITQLVDTIGLDAVQLSGDEMPDDVATLAEVTRDWTPLLKAVRPRSGADLDALDAYAMAGAVLLVDTPARGSYGGTGEAGNWALVHELARRWPIVLAGGLTPENVAEALRATGARGVDVSSGIETGGVKDPAKMRAFVEAARERWTSRT